MAFSVVIAVMFLPCAEAFSRERSSPCATSLTSTPTAISECVEAVTFGA
jgi:hypothetical protein